MFLSHLCTSVTIVHALFMQISRTYATLAHDSISRYADKWYRPSRQRPSWWSRDRDTFGWLIIRDIKPVSGKREREEQKKRIRDVRMQQVPLPGLLQLLSHRVERNDANRTNGMRARRTLLGSEEHGCGNNGQKVFVSRQGPELPAGVHHICEKRNIGKLEFFTITRASRDWSSLMPFIFNAFYLCISRFVGSLHLLHQQ